MEDMVAIATGPNRLEGTPNTPNVPYQFPSPASLAASRVPLPLAGHFLDCDLVGNPDDFDAYGHHRRQYYSPNGHFPCPDDSSMTTFDASHHPEASCPVQLAIACQELHPAAPDAQNAAEKDDFSNAVAHLPHWLPPPRAALAPVEVPPEPQVPPLPPAGHSVAQIHWQWLWGILARVSLLIVLIPTKVITRWKLLKLPEVVLGNELIKVHVNLLTGMPRWSILIEITHPGNTHTHTTPNTKI
uniref:Uncharacterized protein n=1 Tax=Phlebotomus papatasi TaxID=29031 RepID=A0A1B0EXU8_PHLPP